jgi:murein DD-endopeptidase MepM/ murein hydrolase activator NlpD
MRRAGAFLIIMLIAGTAIPAGAEVTDAELREARAIAAEKSAELEDELAVLDAIVAQQAHTEQRIANLQEAMSDREREIAISALAAREQARAMYVSAGATAFQAAVSPEGITRLGTKNAYLDAVVDVDVDAVNQLEFLQQDFAALESELNVLVAEQAELAEEAAAVTEGLMAELDEANAAYQALYSQWQKEEAERQRRRAEQLARDRAAAAAAAAASGNYASSAFVDASGRTCPVDGANTFRDSWLEPRSYRGGYHHGTDLIAAPGTRLVAMEAGYVYSMGWHWAGGNGLYIRGNSGDIYYYAHMQGYAPGLSTGDRLGVGQPVGYVGSTGVSSINHLHLGYQPGGGALVNPYQLLVKLCR